MTLPTGISMFCAKKMAKKGKKEEKEDNFDSISNMYLNNSV
jgi:hypothetical protein